MKTTVHKTTEAVQKTSSAKDGRSSLSLPAVPVLQPKIEKSVDGWKLTIDDDAFEADAVKIFGYLKGKGLLDGLAGKKVLMVKAEGKGDAVCHHWSFGGLNPAFALNIAQIHEAVGGKQKFKSEENPDELPDEFRETVYDWAEIDKNGLKPDGESQILRVYGGNEHSSRPINGHYFHKFNSFEFIFAVEGADIGAAYGSTENVELKVYPASGLGSASWFTYEKE